jgi:hypothetical protein
MVFHVVSIHLPASNPGSCKRHAPQAGNCTDLNQGIVGMNVQEISRNNEDPPLWTFLAAAVALMGADGWNMDALVAVQ